MQLWTHSVAAPRSIGRTAAAAETAGWDGLCVVDSQNVSGDCFVTLAVAAHQRADSWFQIARGQTQGKNPSLDTSMRRTFLWSNHIANRLAPCAFFSATDFSIVFP